MLLSTSVLTLILPMAIFLLLGLKVMLVLGELHWHDSNCTYRLVAVNEKASY